MPKSDQSISEGVSVWHLLSYCSQFFLFYLFQDTEKCINEFEIHHLEWIVNEITLKKLEFIYPRFNTLIKNEPSQIQYSKGVKVIAWGKDKREKTGYNN